MAATPPPKLPRDPLTTRPGKTVFKLCWAALDDCGAVMVLTCVAIAIPPPLCFMGFELSLLAGGSRPWYSAYWWDLFLGVPQTPSFLEKTRGA